MGVIKAIIFDAGGVIQRGSGLHFVSSVRDKLGLEPAGNAVSLVVFDRDMNLGRISVRDALAKMYPNASERQMREMLLLWRKEWPTDWEMIELVKKLKEHYVVSMISNSDPVHEERFREEHVLELFDKPVLSHKAGLVKPDERIFKLALHSLGVKAGECVFIDDAIENVEAAKRLGFKAVRFSGIKQLLQELRGMGIAI